MSTTARVSNSYSPNSYEPDSHLAFGVLTKQLEIAMMLSRGRIQGSLLRCGRWLKRDAVSPYFLRLSQYFTTMKDPDPTDQHRLFLEQMNELDAEQKSLFGSAPEVFENHTANNTVEAKHGPRNKLGEDEIELLKQDREHLYGFTEQEQVAWGAHGGNKQHDPSFLEAIASRRKEHFERLDQSSNQIHDESLQERINPSNDSQPPTSDTLNSCLSHVSADGSAVHMVDVADKELTTRIATAETIVRFPTSVVRALQESNNNMPKGPVFSTAITAGIMAAKQTSNLIPLCHPLFLSSVNVTIDWMDCQSAVRVQCQCKVAGGPTGVEMEALTGCSVAALTIYDMVKAVSHDVVLSSTRLLHKEGGKRHVDIRTQDH